MKQKNGQVYLGVFALEFKSAFKEEDWLFRIRSAPDIYVRP